MKHFVFAAVLLAGCGGSSSSAPPPAPPPAPAASPTPAPEPTVAKKEPDGPPIVLANLAIAVKKQGDQRVLDLSWDVTRNRAVPASTVLFVHSACKVGYGNKYEDSSVGGVEAIPEATARPFKTSAFGFAPLPFDPAHCTFSFAYGPKGSKEETKLASFCWKNGAVTDGPCG